MSRVLACALALASQSGVVALLGCGNADAIDARVPFAIVGESTRYRIGEPLRVTPWFDGQRVSLVAARGEILGLQIVRDSHAAELGVQLVVPGVDVRVFDVESFDVQRPSTAGLYGEGQGRGRYADGLRRIEADSASGAGTLRAIDTSPAPAQAVTYVELHIPRDARPGIAKGELVVDNARYPIDLEIARVTMPSETPHVWAYEDPRELLWTNTGDPTSTSAPASQPSSSPPPKSRALAVPSADERACASMFREYGVLLSPDLHIDWWPARRGDFDGIRDVPVVISDDPAKVGDEVRAWIAATKGTGHVPFAIPIDEPRTPKRIQQVVALGAAIRAAGGGPHTFRFAVTADPRPEWLGLVDQFIQLRPAANSGAWAYNGVPPYSGAMILDAKTPGARTWGWLMHRDGIAQWYVWDALYWHDRHNRKSTPLSERALDIARDPVSFDDGEDHGNLDGVLALPGCQPTLRLAALRRGQQDRQLLGLANACDPMATARVVARTMPRGRWPTDESVWEASRRELIQIAGCR